MNFLKSLFKKKNIDAFNVPITNKFQSYTKTALLTIGNESKDLTEDELYDLLIHQKGIPEFEVGELITFLPIAFCRLLFKDISWPEVYKEVYDNQKVLTRRFHDNQRYIIIEKEAELSYELENRDFTLNLVSRSSEFNAINKSLNDGGELKDVLIKETRIHR